MQKRKLPVYKHYCLQQYFLFFFFNIIQLLVQLYSIYLEAAKKLVTWYPKLA